MTIIDIKGGIVICCDKKVMVTCLYCRFYKFSYKSENDISTEGYCILKNVSRQLFSEICEDFKINPCIHTPKYYPGKDESKS